MSDLDGLLKQIPIGQIARKLGVDDDVARDAVEKVLPTIVAGLSANSKDKAGAASLEKALVKHEGRTPAAVDEIDTDDGEKIVRNVFGSNKDKVVSAVSKTAKADESIIAKILPIVAPIVLSWLASQFLNKKKSTDAAASGSGGIGDLLGGLLGGAAGGKGGGDVLGGLLGGLLGGGKK
ncbi:hypothetical protein GCM10027413_26750 [Conyzicola nivalis]|uniref:DUF937 domain-containing protein n=1 Tax=Conyzicola nivalis TaxID=1477021 RepID=A0A916ST10_9MICO|nr:DUF937 domain-containing protein [Conyzicola nivalis]GGB15604.1 hypothetical protein GCM10010979_32760 [Conyzicola nivalis]